MKKVAWIGHYLSVEDVWRFNNMKIRSYWLRNLYVNLNKRREPYCFFTFRDDAADVQFYGIICPLLPADIASLSRKDQIVLMRKAIMLCNRLKVDQIGIAGMFAALWEDGRDLKTFTDIPLTTGKNLIASLVIDYVMKACEQRCVDKARATIGIVGCQSRVGYIFLKYFMSVFGSVVADLPLENNSWTGKVRAVPVDQVFSLADVIISTSMGLGLGKYIDLLKPGAIICEAAAPFNLTKEIVRRRSDILAFEGVWTSYKQFDSKGVRRLQNMFPDNLFPSCVAEPLMLARGGVCSDFSLGESICLENVERAWRMREEYGFECFGYKQGNRVYKSADLAKVDKLC